MPEITQENLIIDIPGLNRFQIGDHVVVDPSADNDRFEGIIIGIELRRMYGSSCLKPSITLLHDGYITDGFSPMDCRKVEPPPPQTNVAGDLLARWREGEFESTADEAAQAALDHQSDSFDAAPVIEAWLTALATTEGSTDGK